jgi:hypothetical protein
VTFLPPGASRVDLAVPEPGGDTDNPPTHLQFNPEILFPSDPTCGSTAATPCVYDGTKKVSSGFVANFPTGGDFFVKLYPKLLHGGTSTVVNYVCLIHPKMAGSVTLVADQSETETSEVDDVRDRAFDQFERNTRDAQLRAQIDEAVGVTPGRDPAMLRARILSGGPEELIAQIRTYASVGVQQLILNVPSPYDMDGLEHFGSEVLPAFS